MDKHFVEYKGEKFPVRTVFLSEETGLVGCDITVDVCDYDLYAAYKEDYENGVKEIVDLDCSIFFFCDSGFIESDPTDEEIVEYLIKADL